MPRVRHHLAILLLSVGFWVTEATAAPLAPAPESAAELRTRLQKELRGKQMKKARATMNALFELQTPDAIDALLDVALTANVPEIERALAGLFKDLPAGEAFERLCHQANKHSSFQVRVLLTLVLANRVEPEAYRALLTNLYDRNDSVVFAALDALQKKDDLGAVPHLIRALQYQEDGGKKGSMLWYEIRRLLKRLTGRDLELAQDWKNFWDANGSNFERPPPNERDTELTAVAAEKPPMFFGLQVVSRKVVFLLDVSGSMAIKDPLPEGGARSDFDDVSSSRMRLTRVQKELTSVVKELPRTTTFTIITFNHQIHHMTSGLVGASSGNKRRALEFVRNFHAEGETWTDRALAAAFAVPGVDSIFLLSDGAPRRDDTLLPVDPILEWVRDENRFRRVRIHTVGFEQAGSNLKKFMRKLARQNHGLYKELR